MTEENLKESNIIHKLNKKIIIPAGIILVVIVAFLINHYTKFQSTEDAYIDTTTVSVSPKVSGQIVKVLVEDNQKVEAGMTVAIIDKVDYQVALQETSASYDKALLMQENAHANLNAANSEIDLAKKDLERYTNLYNAGAVSKQVLDKAKTHFETVQAQHTVAEQAILSKNPLHNVNVADADLNVLKAKKKKAELALEYTEVKAPIDGTVSGKRVEVGMMVQPGSPLFTIVPNNVWVIANFKETQIENMKPGQEVDIKIDTYPHKIFKGKVDSIQRSSGAKSSLFPPENAVGSFVKIVQRIPVKIVFDESEDLSNYYIIPGMSVIPKVRVKK